jgi:regulator of sigma E protease
LLTVLLGVLAFLVILALLILVHEVGHFSVAKLFRVRVDEFGIGFPPRLKTWHRGQTLYSLNAIPLGGFVRMRGENGDDSAPDSFGAKPPWQRMAVLCAGPAMNLVLAVGVFVIAFLIGSPRNLAVVTRVQSGTPAAAAGLRAGDRILAVDGNQVLYADELQTQVQPRAGGPVVLTVQRGNQVFFDQVTPRLHHPANQGAIGIVLDRTGTFRYGPIQSLRLSFDTVGTYISSLPGILGSIGQHNGANVSGPIGIADQTTQVVQQEPHTGIGTILFFVAILSTSLGVLNLLPVPALDGGRILFVLISWIRRRNLDPEVEGMIHLAGMAALLFLILVVSYHDIVRWVSGGSS